MNPNGAGFHVCPVFYVRTKSGRAEYMAIRTYPACKRTIVKENRELLLPGAPQTAGVRFCCPVRPVPRSIRIMSAREGLNYAARASASLSLALIVFEPLTGYSARMKIPLFNTRRS